MWWHRKRAVIWKLEVDPHQTPKLPASWSWSFQPWGKWEITTLIFNWAIHSVLLERQKAIDHAPHHLRSGFHSPLPCCCSLTCHLFSDSSILHTASSDSSKGWSCHCWRLKPVILHSQHLPFPDKHFLVFVYYPRLISHMPCLPATTDS